MHSANTESQNAEISRIVARITWIYHRARLRPIPDKGRLTEGYSEITWRAETEKYRNVIKTLRYAAQNFEAVFDAMNSPDAIALVMKDFSVRLPAAYRAVTVQDGELSGLVPDGTILLVPAAHKAVRRMLLACNAAAMAA